MKLPRDYSPNELIQALHRYGYAVTRQTGSHIRLTSTLNHAEHHITVPEHKTISTSTLSYIMGDVAGYLNKEKQTLIDELFG